MGVCNCSMYCCTLLYVHSSIAIILMGKRELIALLNLSSWCLVMVERLFLAVPRGCLQFVIVVLPDHTHLLFLTSHLNKIIKYKNMHFFTRRDMFNASFFTIISKHQNTIYYSRPYSSIIEFCLFYFVFNVVLISLWSRRKVA